jgi:hypothetical protein
MKTTILILIGTLTSMTLQAQVVAPYKDCQVVVTNGVLRLDELPRNRVFTAVLDRFSVEPGRSTPESFILTGRVVSNNTGGPVEGVAISIHAAGQVARLAGISDVDGAFRFRVWIDAKPQTVPDSTERMYITLRLPSIGEGDLCLGGAFDTNRVIVSGTVSRYSMSDLKAAAKKPKE